MHKQQLTPREALNKAFLKVKPQRRDIERFQDELQRMIQRMDANESEEFHKNLAIDFLKNSQFGREYFINTKGHNDLVIHTGKEAKSPAGVIVEAKKPANKTEMVQPDQLNAKALQELVLYYLRERITNENLHIKHLVVTNLYEWYLFDATVFEKAFANDKDLVHQFREFEAGRLSGTDTGFFYREIAAPAIDRHHADLQFAHVDLRDYGDIHAVETRHALSLRHALSQQERIPPKMISLFKLFSPEHLLKLPFANDSNSLDRQFYAELLHIIGLTETKQKGKKFIERKKEGQRDAGSLIENTILQLDTLDVVSRLEKPSQYGETNDERLFNVALELVITWINRILFLKLLEAQLISYNKGDKTYGFLNSDHIRDFDQLNRLFFQVLARKPEYRREDIREEFAHVPYLNSSLFDPSEMERQSLFISNLEDDKKLPLLPSTVLKDDTGTRRSGEMDTLAYLLSFLEAYDFASEGSEEVQEENKSLINASVLGLIFEKINGYREGSFFTPGFITMYMSRETLRRAVVRKFNEAKGWNCNTLDEVYDRIDDRDEANRIVNSLKVVDPAVGSGHFLVSALNELIAIKHDLNILQDRNGRRLKEYAIEVANDELVVTDEDNELFEYHPGNPESQRVQETLFHEKQTLIENSLFGVDINPNSVKICRLRLWIELLKNAYYRPNTVQTRHALSQQNGHALSQQNGHALSQQNGHALSQQLETLPNIDINIKRGNSLISRFPLDADLSRALRKSKWSIDSYRATVQTYREAHDKAQKHEMERLIADIKSDFRTEISQNDPKVKRLNKLSGELQALLSQTSMYEESDKEKKEKQKRKEKLEKEIDKLSTELEEIKHNKIYENAFEWRFEFPEVLDENGDFVGFDVVIGNPPYVSSKDFDKKLIKFLNNNYKTSQYQLDLYVTFIEKGTNVLKSGGNISYITPNSWLKNIHFSNCRSFVLKNLLVYFIVPNLENVFEEASVDALIFSGQKNNEIDINVNIGEFIEKKFTVKHQINQSRFLKNNRYIFDVEINNELFTIIKKIRDNSIDLDEIAEITRGVNPYDKYQGQSQEIIQSRAYHSNYKKNDTFIPELRGKHIFPFYYKWDGKHYISYGDWLAAPREWKFFTGKRILMRQVLGDRLNCTLINEDFVIDQSVFIAKPYKEFIDKAEIIQGLLASRLISIYFRLINNEFDALFPKIKIGEFKELPIYRKFHELNSVLSEKVNQILTQKRAAPSADTTALEREIDVLVFKLYGLSYEEVLTVEPEFWLSKEEYAAVEV